MAVVGVIRTLGAALLTQSRADRLKRHELDMTARQQREDRAHAEEGTRRKPQHGSTRADRSAPYSPLALNTTARQYDTQIDLVHALRARDELEHSAVSGSSRNAAWPASRTPRHR
ncbi:hypothetical protein STENM327S_07818 [Streptomyces tendae]